MTKIFWQNFRHNKPAVIGGAILTLLYVSSVFAGFISPYSPELQNRIKFYAPPTPLHFFDKKGNFSLRPFIYDNQLVSVLETKYKSNKTKKYYLRFFVRTEQYSILGLFKTNLHLFGVKTPAAIFLLGSDQYGRDVFSRLLFGSQISLSVGLIGILITFIIGVFIGSIAGFYGGMADTILMRLSELIMSMPGLYLILAIRASFPITIASDKMYIIIVLILSFIGWAGLARVIRGMVLSIKENDYVVAAKSLGASTLHIIIKHILPATFTYIIVAATISVPYYILGEVVLSFLGVGISEPQASWGNMLQQAQSVRVLVSFPWIIAPGFLIFITVLAFNFLGDGLRDALDKKNLK